MVLSEVRTSEDASTLIVHLKRKRTWLRQKRRRCRQKYKNDRFLFFCSSQPLCSMPVCATAKKNQNIEDKSKMDRAVLAVAVGMLYFKAEEVAVRLRRDIWERRARMWRSRRLVAYLQTFSSGIFVCAALLSGIASCLKFTQVTTEASSIKWAEQVHIRECGAYLRTLNWKSTWSFNDDVSQVHEYTSTDKYAYWETAIVFQNVDDVTSSLSIRSPASRDHVALQFSMPVGGCGCVFVWFQANPCFWRSGWL